MARASIRRRLLIAMVSATALTLALFVVGTLVAVVFEDGAADILAGDSFQEEVSEVVFSAMLVAAPLALVVAAITAVRSSRRIAAPLDTAIRAARETTAHDLRRRLPVPARDDEVTDLILGLNDLFARLDDGFGALARFAADASHELRTPLAVMGTELEIALRHPRAIEEWEATGKSTLEQLHRLSALVDGLLTLARAAEAPGTRVDVDLIESADAIIAQLSSTAEQRGIALAGPKVDGPHIVAGNPVTLEIAIRNLVENALAATPRGGHVALDLVTEPDLITVTVDDDGPGMGADPELLFVPFVRANVERTVGAGLGLAIARRIAHAHDGRLEAGISPLGGARLRLAIPRIRA